MNARSLLTSIVVLAVTLGLVDMVQAAGNNIPYQQSRSYRSNSYGGIYGPGVYGGYLSPRGPSSKANQYRVPYYMRADRKALGLFP